MRIGILTFWWTQSNYGQMLQAFALKTYLNELGHDVFFIKYHGSANVQKRTYWDRLIKFNLSEFLERRKQRQLLATELTNHPRYFDQFKNEFLTLGDQSYTSYQELCENPPKADAYICGSDQVWNNNFGISCEPYLLGFGDSTIKRVSYAASFGVKNLSEETKAIFEKHLPNFDAISVREKSGVDLCVDMGFPKAQLLPDPTLLLSKDKWRKVLNISSSTSTEPQMFIYTLGNSPIEDRQKFMDYAKNSQYKIAHVASNHDFTGNIFPTVFEWVKELDKSEFVMTNSFHGMVFCIIFNKNFVVLPNTGKAKGMNERVTSLLERLGLLDHIVENYDPSKLNQLIEKRIDWATINTHISEWQQEAKKFLVDVLIK